MKRKHHILVLLSLLLPAAPATAQTETSVLGKSALEYMLQRPAVSKRFAQKKTADRFFLEMGAGVNNSFSRNQTAYIDWHRFGFGGNVSFGDWLTPEHGIRIGLDAGIFRRSGLKNKAKAYGLTADYLMNITAIANRTYDAPHGFDVIGAAGLDLLRSHMSGTAEWVPGFHLGLRGQARLSYYTYFFLEPRLTIYSDKLLHSSSRFGWRPTASVYAGLGYRLHPETVVTPPAFEKSGTVLDGTFLAFGAGPSAIANGSRDIWTKQVGVRLFGSIGKWFDPNNAMRLSLSLMEYPQKSSDRRAKGGGLSADYMLNLNNVFGGYDPERDCWINGVVGASLNYMQPGNGHKWVPGIGAGLQANLRVTNAATLFLEPRLDFYPKKFAAYAYTSRHNDITASLLAGVSIGQSPGNHETASRNSEFRNTAWYDHLFVEAGIGLMSPLRSSTLHYLERGLAPTAHLGLGKWFNATSGLRVWGEGGQARLNKRIRRTVVGFGADYMWNITNASTGYIPERPFELIGLAGLGAVVPRKGGHPYMGAGLGFKAIWNASHVTSFYAEPMFRAYDNALLPGTTASAFKLDLIGSLTAGIQFNINTAGHDGERAAFSAADQRAFYTLSAGPALTARGLSKLDNIGGSARIGFGRWYSPISAWRVSLGTEALKYSSGKRRKYSGKIFAGADYMTDLTAANFGFDEDRSVSLRSLVGMNLGVRYNAAKASFCPDIHAGLQLAAHIAPGAEVYAEPQLAYQMDHTMKDKAQRIAASLQVGLNYSFRRGDWAEGAASPASNFVEVGIGTGAFSGTVTAAHPRRRKFTLPYGISYGRWFSPRSAVRLGVERTYIQKKRDNAKGSSLTRIHADYMLSLLPQDEGKFHLRATAGVNATSLHTPNKTRWAPGLNASLQGALTLSPSVEIFAEPTLTVFSNKLTGSSVHPVEGEGKLLIGTKFSF